MLDLVLGPGDHLANICIGLHFRPIEKYFLAPDQPGLRTERDDLLEELVEDFQPITFSDLGQTTVIGNCLLQVVANEPKMGNIQMDLLHQLPF